MIGRLSGRQRPNAGPDHKFTTRVSTHCLGERSFDPSRCTPKKLGATLAHWDGKNAVLGASGAPLALSLDADGQFFCATKKAKLIRVANVVNEMRALGQNAPVTLDMHDARTYGATPETSVSWPIVTYNRRKNAKNLVLWPLPGFHTPGMLKYVHQTPIDPFSFSQKLDIARWCGHLSGPTAAPDLSASAMLRKLSEGTLPSEDTQLLAYLHGNTRFSVVSRFYGSTSVQAALALKGKYKTAALHPLLAKYCQARVSPRWFFKAKYILSLSGTDTGSNFLMAANSRSVVLKEEDGWELFYTGAFQPWVHYIPLSLGAPDIEEKLAWARANPKACQELSHAARAVCASIAKPQNRRLILLSVLEGLNTR